MRTERPEAVIVATARSPIGRARKGSLRELRADDLTVQMVNAALARVPMLDPNDLDDLMLGCGLPGAEQGWNMARNVAVLAGYDHLPGTTVTRYCSSSLQTTRMAFHAIRAGEGDAFISAGVELVSRFDRGSSDEIPGVNIRNPHFDDAQRRTGKLGGGEERWHDPRLDGALPDVYITMGQTAENVQQITGISREEQDAFAVRSQNLAESAVDAGFWASDITPAVLPNGTVVSVDDGPRRGVTMQVVSSLAPVFRPGGTVTAGNSCPLNDGAAAVVVLSRSKADDVGAEPLARIISTGVSGISPEIMGLGPIEATNQALARAGMNIEDIDLAEINEAFAVQALASAQSLHLPIEKVNVNGGAIALGHPFGMTGARITSTLINSLRYHDKTIGLETMCVGGGMGMAMIVERLS